MIKKKQKGRLPLIKKRGIFKKEGYISIKTNKSLYLKPLHIKAIKLSISYYLGQINKIISRSIRQSLLDQPNHTQYGYGTHSQACFTGLGSKSVKSGLSYNWLLTSKHPIFNKSGQRLGGGKSKIKDFYYKIPKNFVILIIKLPLFSFSHEVNKGNVKGETRSSGSIIKKMIFAGEQSKRNIPITSFEENLIILKKVAATSASMSSSRKGQSRNEQQIENLTKLILKENKPKILKEYINYMTKINKGLYFILKKYPFLSIKS